MYTNTDIRQGEIYITHNCKYHDFKYNLNELVLFVFLEKHRRQNLKQFYTFCGHLEFFKI